MTFGMNFEVKIVATFLEESSSKKTCIKNNFTNLPNSLGFSCSYKNVRGNYDSTYPQKELKGRRVMGNTTSPLP